MCLNWCQPAKAQQTGETGSNKSKMTSYGAEICRHRAWSNQVIWGDDKAAAPRHLLPKTSCPLCSFLNMFSITSPAFFFSSPSVFLHFFGELLWELLGAATENCLMVLIEKKDGLLCCKSEGSINGTEVPAGWEAVGNTDQAALYSMKKMTPF